MKALSVRQPWSFLIANGFKNIENRSWSSKFRGEFLIHAGFAMAMDEYDIALDLCRMDTTIKLPAPKDLPRGGFVGLATMTGCVTESESPWFFGPYGFTLENQRPMAFIPSKGQLGFFNADWGR